MLGRLAPLVASCMAFVSSGLVSADSPPSNGASGSIVTLTQAGLNFVSQDVLDPLIASYLNDLKIADVDTKKDGIKIEISEIYTHDFVCTDCIKVSLLPGQGLHVDLSNFDIRLHSHVKLHKIISTSCTCDSKLKNAAIGIDVAIGVGSDGHPTLTASSTTSALSDIDLDCDGVAGSILDALAWAFKSKVVDEMQSAVATAMPQAVQKLSQRVANVSLDLPLSTKDNFAEIRFDLATAPTVAAGYIGVPTLGTIVPESNPGQVAPYPIPDMPFYDASLAKYVQVFISDFTLNSALYTFWQAGRLHHTVLPADIPATAPLQLNTSALSVVAPGFATKYPTPVPVEMFVEADPLSKPTVTISAAGPSITVEMPSLLSFRPMVSPTTTVEGFTLSCPVVADATMTITGQIVAGDLTHANCTLTEFNSTVGAINVEAVNALAELVLNTLVLPDINAVANKGFPLPSVDNYKLKDPVVKLYDHYATIASDLQPTTAVDRKPLA